MAAGLQPRFFAKKFLMLALFLIRFSRAFHPSTVQNRVLSGHVLRKLHDIEWMLCLQACQDEPQCVSYNFLHLPGREGGSNCELNDCGLNTLCDRETLLIYSAGWIFQQITSPEVTQSCTTLPSTDLLDSGSSLSYPAKTVDDYVVRRGMPSLSAAFSVCFWMKTAHGTKQVTPFSYVGTKWQKELMIHMEVSDSMDLFVGGESRPIGISVDDGKWHHICATWSSSDGSWSLYKDGGAVSSGSNFKSGYVIPGGGTIVLGQEQVSGDHFKSSQSFIGELANFNMWSYKLKAVEIMSMSKSCSSGSGNVFQWSSFKSGIRGNVKVVKPSSCGFPR